MTDLVNILSDQDRYIKLFSDSLAAIQIWNSSTVSSQLVKDTIKALNLVGGRVERLEIS